MREESVIEMLLGVLKMDYFENLQTSCCITLEIKINYVSCVSIGDKVVPKYSLFINIVKDV